MEVIRCEYLPLDDGEVNLNLIEPAGMDWGVYEEQIGPFGSGGGPLLFGRDERSSCP